MDVSSKDTEMLRKAMVQSLQATGVLGKIKAQLQAAVFTALDSQEQHAANERLSQHLETRAGKLVAFLLLEYLECYNLFNTKSVLLSESPGLSQIQAFDRTSIAGELGLPVSPTAGVALLHTLIENYFRDPPQQQSAQQQLHTQPSASAAHDTTLSKPSATEKPADHCTKRVVFNGAKPDFSRPLKVDARSALPEMDRPGYKGKKAKALMAPDSGLQAAITKARLAAKPRDRDDQVSANKVQNISTELQRKMDTALATGFPASDPLVVEARTLVARLGEMRAQATRDAHASTIAEHGVKATPSSREQTKSKSVSVRPAPAAIKPTPLKSISAPSTSPFSLSPQASTGSPPVSQPSPPSTSPPPSPPLSSPPATSPPSSPWPSPPSSSPPTSPLPPKRPPAPAPTTTTPHTNFGLADDADDSDAPFHVSGVVPLPQPGFKSLTQYDQLDDDDFVTPILMRQLQVQASTSAANTQVINMGDYDYIEYIELGVQVESKTSAIDASEFDFVESA